MLLNFVRPKPTSAPFTPAGTYSFDTREERAAARIPILEFLGIERWMRARYRTRLESTVSSEYRAFKDLTFPAEQIGEIKGRVAASICTIAAFSAWYDVVWALVTFGFRLAILLAILTPLALTLFSRAMWSQTAALGIAVVTSLATVGILGWILFRFLLQWRRKALICAIAATLFLTIAQIAGYVSHESLWIPAIIGATSAAATLCATVFFTLIFGQLLSQYVTRRKITTFPEEEIIQSITSLLTRYAASSTAWRIPEERAKAVEALEWIARRFEGDLVRRYIGSDPSIDPRITAIATDCAAAFRMRKIALAFPNAETHATFRLFLWNALRRASAHQWHELERRVSTTVAAKASWRARLRSGFASAATITIPLTLGLFCTFGAGAFSPDPTVQAVLRSSAIYLFSWSLVSVLSAINPRKFETQAALVDQLRKGPAG